MRSFDENASYIGWKESFSAAVGGDEVRAGKPSPEM